MSTSEKVLVYGAYGHTGRFVVDELLRRGATPVLAGRPGERLEAYAGGHPRLDVARVALEDRAGLRRAAESVGAVINCAGPFLDTALPLAGAAVAAGAHYVDVTAEQPAVQAVYRELDAAARAAGVAVVPAMAFYGGLADLLATTAMGEWDRADGIFVAIGLDRWWPTAGTRLTGRRNTAARLVLRDEALVPLADPAPTGTWRFPEPFGEQPVVALPFSEVLVLTRHLQVGEVRSWLNTASLADLRDPDTPPPSAVDATGRSAQRFVIDVVVRRGAEERRIGASGTDIYAVTAPIAVEGALRLLRGQGSLAGAVAPGEVFDAAEVLAALSGSVDVSHPLVSGQA